MENISICAETPSDYTAVRGVIYAAFGRLQEADLVDAIRKTEGYHPEYSLIATVDGVICGHVMLSTIKIAGKEQDYGALCLAPLSVLPKFQRKGIGSKLAREVLELARMHNELAVTVEGDPNYYSRFGFEPGYDYGVKFCLPDWAPEDAGRILFLGDVHPIGEVVYPKAFEIVE